MVSTFVYLLIILVFSIIGILKFKYCDITFKLLTALLFYTFISEVISTFLEYTSGNNSIPQKIYTLFHIAIFTSIYYTIFDQPLIKKIVLFVGVIFFLYALYYIIKFNKSELPSYLIMLDAIILVFFSILYYFELVLNPNVENILSSGNFWLNTSVILYFTGVFIFFASFNYLLLHNKNILIQLGNIKNFFLDPLHYFLLGLSLCFHLNAKKKLI